MKNYLTKCISIALRSRSTRLREFAWAFFQPKAEHFSPASSSVRILVGGDVSFDPELRVSRYMGVYPLKKKSDPAIPVTRSHDGSLRREQTRKIGTLSGLAKPFVRVTKKILQKTQTTFWRMFFSPKFRHLKSEYPRELSLYVPPDPKRIYIPERYATFVPFTIRYPSGRQTFSYPFEKIAPFLKQKDLVWVNLETPLTSHPRPYGYFMSDPQYAAAMRDAGVSAVSVANNHIFDAGEAGFLESLRCLTEAGISYVGGGNDLADAKQGRLIEVRGLRLMLLSYTQFCNMRFASIAAKYPGILPIDRQLMVEDVKISRAKADFVFVSLHWGIENDPIVRPEQVEIAHLLIDNGADGIIGHHPHVPQGIEVYNNKFILYSLGNFIFAQGDTRWRLDNFLAEIVLNNKCIQGIILHPIAGQGSQLFQPELLRGSRADSFLREMQIKSAIFNTGIYIENGTGWIKIAQ